MNRSECGPLLLVTKHILKVNHYLKRQLVFTTSSSKLTLVANLSNINFGLKSGRSHVSLEGSLSIHTELGEWLLPTIGSYIVSSTHE